MVNPYLLLAYIGMVLVGLIAVLWWKIKKKVKWKYFCFGSLLWIIAIIIKSIMDFSISTPLVQGLALYGTVATLVGTGLYVGLRTGFFESGLSYLAVKKTEFRKMKLNEAMAFGIGFGAVEAIVVGALTLISIAAIISDPTLLEALTPEQQVALNLPTIVVAAPILERIFVLAVHIFTSLLVIYAVMKRKTNYLLFSILFKTLLDGMVPALIYFFDLNTVSGIYTAEIPVLIFGLVSLYGIRWIVKKF